MKNIGKIVQEVYDRDLEDVDAKTLRELAEEDDFEIKVPKKEPVKPVQQPKAKEPRKKYKGRDLNRLVEESMHIDMDDINAKTLEELEADFLTDEKDEVKPEVKPVKKEEKIAPKAPRKKYEGRDLNRIVDEAMHINMDDIDAKTLEELEAEFLTDEKEEVKPEVKTIKKEEKIAPKVQSRKPYKGKDISRIVDDAMHIDMSDIEAKTIEEMEAEFLNDNAEQPKKKIVIKDKYDNKPEKTEHVRPTREELKKKIRKSKLKKAKRIIMRTGKDLLFITAFIAGMYGSLKVSAFAAANFGNHMDFEEREYYQNPNIEPGYYNKYPLKVIISDEFKSLYRNQIIDGINYFDKEATGMKFTITVGDTAQKGYDIYINPENLEKSVAGRATLNPLTSYGLHGDIAIDDSALHVFGIKTTTIHELAHVVGLAHSRSLNSIMYPVLCSFKLSKEDIKNINTIYPAAQTEDGLVK